MAPYHSEWCGAMRMCYTREMQTLVVWQKVSRRAISFALVAALAFALGLQAGGNPTTAAIISRVPLLGDGLDPTPDRSADLADFWKAWNVLESDYVETYASSTPPSPREKVLGAIGGLTDSYNDPYTVFLPPEEAKAFQENISGSFAGVGMEIDIKEGVLTVVAPLKGTPAVAAGIRAGDLIIAIDGKTTEGMAVEVAVGRIRGPAGTVVELALVRDKKPFTVKVTRARIQVPQTDEEFDEANGIYRIALFEFTSESGNLFNQAFKRFKASGARKLIIDLRGNPGGFLDVAVDVASHFLPRGTEVVKEDFGGKADDVTHVSAGYNDLPRGTKVVVLIDGGSASASEIVAGALKDHKIVTVIGQRSFGKGSVQELIPLGDGSLKITIARWVTPAGTWIIGNGVTPDIAIPVTPADIAAKKDPQLARAVQFLNTGK